MWIKFLGGILSGGVAGVSVCDGGSVVKDTCDEARVYDLALSKLGLEPGMTLLDVGCSTKLCVVPHR